MGRGGQEGFVLSFPQVDNNLRKALKLGVAEEKENTLFAHTYWLKFWGKLYSDFFCQKLLSECFVIILVLSLGFLVSALSEITVMQLNRLKKKENKNLRRREITEL